MKIQQVIPSKLMLAIVYVAILITSSLNAQTLNNVNMHNTPVHYSNIEANGVNLFYREAGPKDAPVILLLHGYPTSSHMFRNLIPMLSEKYHVIAPDLPGFGFSEAKSHDQFEYTFDNMAKTMQSFVDKLGLKKFALYVFDYGAPTGFRLAMANPEKVTAIISQNGNAYAEGLSTGWNPIRRYWEHPTRANRDSLKDFVSKEATWYQYHEGVSDPTLVAPESYTMDQYFLDRPGNIDIQLDLVLNYRTNVALYPKFQEYFRKYQPPFLAVWGNKDPYFLPAGAEAYKRDLPKATVKFYNTGHFALETNAQDIGNDIMVFMKNNNL